MEQVVVLRRYPFAAGQKITIEDGPRRGDWEVVDIDEKKIYLRCPASGVQVQWDRFCYFIREEQRQWPGPA